MRNLIEELIDNKVMTYDTGRKLIIDAYNNGKIERWEYEDLMELAKKYLG